MNTLKIAYIGMGYRGKQHIPYFQVTAIADPEAREADYDVPCYNQGGDDYQRMITLHAPQLVFIASPWQLHVTHALYCIQHGCNVALEIKGGKEKNLSAGEHTFSAGNSGHAQPGQCR